MDEVIIYTDGACSGNPGPGGWGAILMYKNTKKAHIIKNTYNMFTKFILNKLYKHIIQGGKIWK